MAGKDVDEWGANSPSMNFFKLFSLLLVLATQAIAQPAIQMPPDCRQVVVVTNRDWDDTTATMIRFEREDQSSHWHRKGAAVPVNLGRTGLAWGSSSLMEPGLAKGAGGAQKKEGDGRAPAGIFPFLKAFGHPKAPKGYGPDNLPFVLVEDHQCVDDSDSEFYNQVVKPQEVGGVSWDSAETMKIDLYRLGLVVGHNCPKAVPGLGSCIFFHLERAPGSPTAGCTAMAEAALAETMLWLETDKKPVLIQMPKAQYQKLRGPFPKI